MDIRNIDIKKVNTDIDVDIKNKIHFFFVQGSVLFENKD